MLRLQIKNFIAWTLTLVMCYNILGYVVLFRATDLFHSSMMKELLCKAELSIIKIPNHIIKNNPEIFIRLNEDEIFYDGNYYDVKNEKSTTTFTFFYTLKDAGEKDWHQQLCNAQINSNENLLQMVTNIF